MLIWSAAVLAVGLAPSTPLGRARALLPKSSQAGIAPLAQALTSMGVDVQTCPLSPAECAKMRPDYAYIPRQGYQKSGAFLIDTGNYRFSDKPGVNTAKVLIQIYPSLKDPKEAQIRLELMSTKPGYLGGDIGFVYLLPGGAATGLETGFDPYCEYAPACRAQVVFPLAEPAALLEALLPYVGTDGQVDMQKILLNPVVARAVSRWNQALADSEQDMPELKAALPKAGFAFQNSYDNTVPFTRWGSYSKQTPAGKLVFSFYYSSMLNLGLDKAEVSLENPPAAPKKLTFSSLSEFKAATRDFTDFDGLLDVLQR